jgi:uncharacterized protein YbcV (DUF1398 family)
MVDFNLIQKITDDSLAGTIQFPECISTLMAAGVESYRVDLVRKEKIMYAPNGENAVEKLAVEDYPIGIAFSQTGVQKAVRKIQEGEISYKEFLNLISDAGVTHYMVFLIGKQTVYFGRHGDMHIEMFSAQTEAESHIEFLKKPY